MKSIVMTISLFTFCFMCAQCASHSNEENFDISELKKDFKFVDKHLQKIRGSAHSQSIFQHGPGDYERFIRIGWRKRRYTLHVPSSYDSRKPTPLVLNFHGGGGRSASARLQSKMDMKADSAGFIVVYPDGTGTTKFSRRLLTWNAGSCCGNALEKNIDDIEFVKAVLNDVETLFNIDSKRIYATGLSNGAMMVYRLACELSDRIAAIAPVVAAMGMEECNPSRSISIIHFHGTADKNAPFEGGVGEFSVSKIHHISVRDDIDFWIEKNKCAKEPVEKYTKRNATVGVYRAKDGTEVKLVKIEGLGHGWPGGRQMLKKSMEGEISNSIDANDMIWDFFQKHPMQ